jgi:hypothetical protein
LQSLPLTRVTERVDQAIRLASKGIKVFPLHSLQKGSSGETVCTCGDLGCESVAKHPVGQFGSWKEVATHDLKTVREMWQKAPFANIGVVCGKVNGFFVLDIDGEAGMETLHEWILEYGEMPITWQVNTGNGMHLYYKYPEGLPEGLRIGNTRSSLGFGIDTRGDNGYVVGADSLHWSNVLYTWAGGRSPQDIEIGEAPDFLVTMLKELHHSKLGEEELNNIAIGDYRKSTPDVVMKKALELKRISRWFLDAIKGNRNTKDKSQSGIDMAIANCLVKNGWTDQEIVEFLYHQRVVKKEKLKWPGYYKSTVAKARKWGGDVEDNVVEFRKAEAEVAAGLDNVGLDNEEAIPILEEPTVRAFPVHVFPKPVRDFVYAVAKGVQVPDDLVGVHALTLLGAGIGATRRIEVKEGWQEQPNLYSMVVAEPGTGKSPALAKVFNPILTMQTVLKEKYDEELIEYQKQLKACEHDKTIEEPSSPILEELYVTSATIEAINNIMSLNPRGIVAKADELSGTFKGWGQYKGGKGDDEESMLSNWSGTDIKINRVGKPPLVIPNPFCAMTGNITPNTVSSFKGEKEDNGLIHRFLIAYPDKQKTPRWTKKGVKSSVAQAYEKVLMDLYKLSFKRVNDRNVPEVLYMNAEAEELFSEWFDKIMAEMDKEDFPKKLRGVWSKMPSQVVRIALILQMTWAVCNEASRDEIEVVIMQRAITVGEYFMSHARKVYFHLGDVANEARINEALTFIKASGGRVLKREIQRKRISGCKKGTDVDRLFEELVDLGYGIVEKEPSSGRPKIYFRAY